MTTTTYYDLNIVEGTDIVNPLTVDNPNYQKIDEAMHDNAVAGVTLATELTNATIHALTRENSDCSVIRFIATSRWKAGDSVTVDGVPVLALLPSGETLPDGAYVINANVLCVLTGTNLTVYVSKSSANASDITYKETNVEEALNSLNESMVTVTSDLSTVSGNVSRLTTSLEEVNSKLDNVGFCDLIGTVNATGTTDLTKNINEYRFLYFMINGSSDLSQFVPVQLFKDVYNSESKKVRCGLFSGGSLQNATEMYYLSETRIECVAFNNSVYVYGIK